MGYWKSRIIYDEIPNELFEVGVSGKIWAEHLNIFEKAHKQLLQTEQTERKIYIGKIYRHC